MPQPTDRLWERWEEVDRLFEAVLDQAPEARGRFLSEACGGDRELVELIRSLLDHDAAASGPLAGPGPSLLRALWAGREANEPERPALAAGARVGQYRVRRELGRGGMATVYEAERDDGAFQQRVAVKLLRPGLDTEELVRRFLAERQILSGLSHPHIARLLDGGATEDGRPFLVMERVVGEPITRWAEARRLPVAERLALFLQVADAVQFAHRRLVIHRDLKPSNVLVDDEARVKLLDFGIAKLLGTAEGEAGEPLTRTGSRPLTPEYASPEQVRGDAVTTASDVYQLGVLLYLLLAGRRPFSGRGAEFEAAITSGKVTRPSDAFGAAALPAQRATASGTAAEAPSPAEIAAARGTTPEGLRRALRGDLDSIVLKAMRTEPEERYGSAEAMAEDVRRSLAGRPITARPASVPYRLRKFARRNRWFAPVTALLVFALAAYLATVATHARALEREHNEARAQAERAEELRTFLVDLFRAADPYTTPDPERGRAITVVEALEVGAERARRELGDRPPLRAAILSAIAGVYTNLDVREPARALLEEAMAIRHSEGADRSAAQLDDLGRLANLIGIEGNRDSAIALFNRRLVLERELHGPDHPRVADALVGLASQESVLARFAESLQHRQEAVRILRAAGPEAAAELARALGLLSNDYRASARLDDAEAAAREAVAMQERLFGARHANTAVAKVHLAQLVHERGHFAEAVSIYHEVLPVLEHTLGPVHFITLSTWNNLAVSLGAIEDHRGAEAVQRRVLELRRTTAASGRSDLVAGALQNLAVSLLRQGRHAEAEHLTVEAHKMYREVLPAGHYLVAFPLLTRAEIQLDGGDAAGAERSAREATRILRAGLPAGHFATAAAECRLGGALVRQAHYAEAKPLIERALGVLEASEQAPLHLQRECADNLAALAAAGPRQ